MTFRRALRRLTLVYTLIQLVLFGSLAIGIYLFVTSTFDFDAASQDGSVIVGTAEQGFTRLRIALIIGFAILCVVVPFTSYWMARAALAPLRASYKQQQHFVDDASHAFRSPLSVIRGELELALMRERSAEEYRRSITTSLDSAQALVQLTGDLLLLAGNSSTEFRSHFQAVSTRDVVREAIGALETATAERLILCTGPVAVVQGVPSLLARAVANVLDNAMKYTPTSGTVTLTTATESKKAIITVTDTGIGMDASDVRHAFERFWRSPNISAVSGHGLGLALVQRVAYAHNGRATIVSSPGSGSTVSLILPIAHNRSRRRWLFVKQFLR